MNLKNLNLEYSLHRLLATSSPRSASPLRHGGRAASPALRIAARGIGVGGGRGSGTGSPLLPRPQRRTLPPSRSLSLDTGLDTNNAASADPETATDVVTSCEQYLQQQHNQQPEQSPVQQSREPRPPRRRLSSIPCDTSPIAEEECGIDEDSRSDQQSSVSPRSSLISSRRSSLASTDDLNRKPSFVNKCMTRVRGFIKK
ncbi:hypothetical protein GWK47_015184 [Chionoecetes opilio]|uniref:Uncharacterized protein n=1 Tax=Chionoecetes opilio TaxID=41210 RepID=A0A8J4XXK0_CHIOP|nr:hypothetical protein GWK47_015184 [Chionoecetes opilio]